MAYSEKILGLLATLEIKEKLPVGIEVLNPYREAQTFELCERFYKKYYCDDHQRHLILGINPGRMGGGLTGIPFTDPNKLQDFCGIPNTFPKRSELSADFIYQVINTFGGLENFFGEFYVSSVSPLGFTLEGKNANYYDMPKLQSGLRPFIIDCMKKQLAFGLNTDVCFILGEGKNFDYVQKLNQEFKFFKRLVPLPHPRFIMQYKRKKMMEYVQQYVHTLQENCE